MNFTFTDLICAFSSCFQCISRNLQHSSYQVFRPGRDLREDDRYSCYSKSEEILAAKRFFPGSHYWSPMKQAQSIGPSISGVNAVVYYVLYSKPTQGHFHSLSHSAPKSLSDPSFYKHLTTSPSYDISYIIALTTAEMNFLSNL